MADREPYRRHLGNASMNLPAGKTCGDCVHIARCAAIFGHQANDEVCDWSPSRFHEALPVQGKDTKEV